MKILHYIPQSDDLINRYVNLLTDSMGLEANNTVATSEGDAKESLNSSPYDILHIHGCWQRSAYRIFKMAAGKGVRMVLSPYGQLEPWVVDENYWKEKLPKKLLYQRHLVEEAYAVIIQGKMEEECIRKLGWNQRMEIIRNPIITHSITSTEMAQKTYTVYRKVLDSNTIELMKPQTGNMLRCFIKAGITGDNRWVTDDLITIADYEQWRHLLCYAHQENIYSIWMPPLRLSKRASDFNMLLRTTVWKPLSDRYANSFCTANSLSVTYAKLTRNCASTMSRKTTLQRRFATTSSTRWRVALCNCWPTSRGSTKALCQYRRSTTALPSKYINKFIIT